MSVRPFRLILVLCLFAFAAGVPAASAREQAAPRRDGARVPVLAGNTTITGSKTAVTMVDLPSRAQIRIKTPGEDPMDGKPVPGTAISSRARVAGFYLTDPDVTDPSATSLLGVRMRFCPESGCTGRERAYQFGSSSENNATTSGEHKHPDWATLPPGRYLLHLFTDGSPVKVHLRLKGLQGSTTIRPSAPVGSGVSVPTVANSTTAPGEKAFWYGDAAEFSGPAGMFVGALRMDVKAWSYLKWGACIAQGEPVMPPALAYSPLCPGGVGAGVSRTELVPVDRGFIYPMFAFVFAGGPWQFGQHFAGVFGDAEFDSVALHMDLDPAAAR